MSNPFVEPIVAALTTHRDAARTQFRSTDPNHGARFFFIDHLLPEPMARQISDAFPQAEAMRLLDTFRERKYTSKNLDAFPPILRDITFAVQDARVLALVEDITGITKQEPDPQLYAGGLSLMTRGHFLNPHLDNSHDQDRRRYRTVNLLYYVTPDWQDGNGGHLELWDESVKRPTVIHSRFNRLIVMETNRRSWHSVSPVTVDGARRCVSNYYFSTQSPEGQDYFHVTSYSARPEQRLRRVVAAVDNSLRMLARVAKRSGFGKRDLYRGPKA